jgi:hypothetical protein
MTLRSVRVSRTDIYQLQGLSDQDFEDLGVYANEIDEHDTYVNDSIYKLVEIFADIKANGFEVACIDNFQLLTDGRGRDLREKLEYLSKAIMRARNEGLKIFVLAQGNADSSSFGSAQILMDGDLCILIEQVYEKEGKKKVPIAGLRELVVKNSRFSPTGALEVIFQGQYSRVKSIAAKITEPATDEFFEFIDEYQGEDEDER